MLLSFLALAVALLASFVFAGSETAITSMGELRIRKLLENKQGPRHWLELWLHEPSHVLTTLLAGNTIANIFASAVTTSMALRLSDRWNLDRHWLEAVGIGGLTVIILIGGEIAPKTLAKNHPEWFLPLMHIVWWFHLTTRWFTQLMIWAAMYIVRALGGKDTPTGYLVTEEQIEDMVRIGSEEGSIDEDRGDILQNVFDLGGLMVRAIMTPRTQIDGLAIEASFEEVAQTVQSSRFSRYPVYDKTLDKIVGIFNSKELMDFALSDRTTEFRLVDHVRETYFVPETKKAIELLKELQTGKVHMAIVVDEHGGTAGIVTMEDVLEELIGEIYDEYDQPEPVAAPAGPNGWTLEASTEIRDLKDDQSIDLPDTPGYSTVGGFLIDQFGRVPKQGEELRWNDLTFRILEADETRVMRVEIQRDVGEFDREEKTPNGRHISGPHSIRAAI